MAEGKYGRLFTEADVRDLMTQLADVAEVDRMLDGFEGTFPADEPLFLLRGQDAAALSVVGDYARRCGDGAPVGGGLATRRPGLAHLKAVHAAWEAMEKWQRANRGRVKVPE